VIYLRAGLYAEGPTDYRFLGSLIERLLYELGAVLLSGRADVAETWVLTRLEERGVAVVRIASRRLSQPTGTNVRYSSSTAMARAIQRLRAA
jgi:hypothetical protein